MLTASPTRAVKSLAQDRNHPGKNKCESFCGRTGNKEVGGWQYKLMDYKDPGVIEGEQERNCLETTKESKAWRGRLSAGHRANCHQEPSGSHGALGKESSFLARVRGTEERKTAC